MLWLLMLAPSVAALGFPLDDERYHQLPKLFDLDDYEGCLSQKGGIFCLGTFELSTDDEHHKLFHLMKEFSSDLQNFNHTRLHRGYCVSSRCQYLPSGPSTESRFEQCVDHWSSVSYGLNATLIKLDYCKTGDKPRSRPIDKLDIIFAGVFAVIVVFNILGTLYDVCRSQDNKPNRFLEAWSFFANWRRLTATHDDGDPRLSALNPVQGMKAITLILIMMAHTSFSHFTGYIHNPIFFEKQARNPLTYYFYNGTVIVQTFVMLSSFLMAYNLLLHIDNNPKKTLGLSMLPQCLFHRLARITPLYLFVVGLAATWWTHANDGVLWTPLVEQEVARCRHKFWAQALFVNNLYEPDQKCLIQTWFLAVDMQLYLLAAVLTLALGRWPRAALKIFGVLFLASIVATFVLSYEYELKSVLFLMQPEVIRNQLSFEPSFNWLYTAPWGSLPSSLLGLFLAFLHYDLEKREFRAQEHKWLRVLYRITVPLMFLWVVAGYWFKDLTTPLTISLYTAVDRSMFVFLTGIAMMGFFHKIDGLWWKFLSWRGFQILGRMSLPILLFHWSYNLTIIGGRLLPSQASVLSIGGDWFATIFLTYVTSLAASLFIELPMQKFLQNIFG